MVAKSSFHYNWSCIYRILCLIITLLFVSEALAQNTLKPPASAATQTTVPFTALHTYYISPTGNDRNSGTSPSAPWATPHHNVVCGDVIVAAAGTYSSPYGYFGTNSWGTVSNCPSTTGGIDGTGGIYFAVVLCAGPNLSSCQVNGNNYEAFRVDQSNWAVEGFTGTQNTKGNSGCFLATSEVAGATRHHIAFINDIASTCDSQGFASVTWTNPQSGADQTAVVGSITFNTSPSLASPCASGISMIPVNGPDTSAGTHVFVAGNFGYKNINAPSGASCNTDGEGLIFDSWSCTQFTHQGVAEQNVWWGNGGAGFEVFPNCRQNGDKAQIYVFHNTSYGNEQDPKHGSSGELDLNQLWPTSASGGYYSVHDNIFVANLATQGGSSSAPVYGAGVYLNNSSVSSVSGNTNYIWQSNPGTSTTAGNPNTDVYVNGSHNKTSFPFGTNTYNNPGFANPGSLPTTAPNCASYTNTTDCMNKGYNVAANLTPSGGAAGEGYQPPGACAPDPYFPVWLKGVIYLQWNGGSLTQNTGLITKPCNM